MMKKTLLSRRWGAHLFLNELARIRFSPAYLLHSRDGFNFFFFSDLICFLKFNSYFYLVYALLHYFNPYFLFFLLIRLPLNTSTAVGMNVCINRTNLCEHRLNIIRSDWFTFREVWLEIKLNIDCGGGGINWTQFMSPSGLSFRCQIALSPESSRSWCCFQSSCDFITLSYNNYPQYNLMKLGGSLGKTFHKI
jgi:hypothetical protein